MPAALVIGPRRADRKEGEIWRMEEEEEEGGWNGGGDGGGINKRGGNCVH
jgi:hypothetical protein